MFSNAKTKIITEFLNGTENRPPCTVEFSSNMAYWKLLMEEHDWCTRINPVFDQEKAGYNNEEAFFVHIRNKENGELVATEVVRLFPNSDLHDLLLTRRFWFKDADNTVNVKDILIDKNKITGNVGHDGAIFVNPNYRKMGIASLISLLMRMAASEKWNIDHQTGFVYQDLADAQFPLKVYKFHHTLPCTTHCLFSGTESQVHLCLSSKDEIVDQANKLITEL